jgi:phosphoribosyl-AMP cyclohydrolase
MDLSKLPLSSKLPKKKLTLLAILTTDECFSECVATIKGNLSMIQLNFDKMGGLIPAIAQDYATGEVLMLAFMNQEAWQHTLSSGQATYFSRSRNTLWVKGQTSGHVQWVKEIRIDCDADTILLKVQQVGGAACHTGFQSCFHRRVAEGSVEIIGQPVFDPKEVYHK